MHNKANNYDGVSQATGARQFKDDMSELNREFRTLGIGANNGQDTS